MVGVWCYKRGKSSNLYANKKTFNLQSMYIVFCVTGFFWEFDGVLSDWNYTKIYLKALFLCCDTHFFGCDTHFLPSPKLSDYTKGMILVLFCTKGMTKRDDILEKGMTFRSILCAILRHTKHVTTSYTCTRTACRIILSSSRTNRMILFLFSTKGMTKRDDFSFD
jgi:hypothetical protein